MPGFAWAMDLQRGSEGTGNGYAKWFEARVGHGFASCVGRRWAADMQKGRGDVGRG